MGMDSSYITKIMHKVSNWQMKSVSAKWIVVLMCLLSLVLVEVSAKYQQTLSVRSGAATGFEPVQPNEAGQVQDLGTLARSNDKFAAKPTIWPVSGAVTSVFGWRNSPWGGGSELHPGIDIAGNMDTPIVATADGIVVRSEWSEGYGNIVQIDHGDNISTIYGHNSRIIVKAGQSVRKGQIISYLGSTGRSTGPHAHYEIRVNGTAVDPISFLVSY